MGKLDLPMIPGNYEYDADSIRDCGAINLRTEVERTAIAGLQHKIDAAIAEAHAQGMDFVHTPVRVVLPSPFEVRNLMKPVEHRIEVRGGAVLPGQHWPHDWTVYRCPEKERDPEPR